MPTYEYECLSCGTRFDTFQKMSDSPLDKCVQCQGSVRRLVSGGSGLIFKGSGFYITDYAKGKGSSGSETKSPGTKKKTSTTSDKKTQPKQESSKKSS